VAVVWALARPCQAAASCPRARPDAPFVGLEKAAYLVDNPRSAAIASDEFVIYQHAHSRV